MFTRTCITSIAVRLLKKILRLRKETLSLVSTGSLPLTLAVAVASCFCVVAEDTQSVYSETATSCVVRVGYYPFEGFNMRGSNGDMRGYGYEFIQKLRDYNNWTFEYSDPKYDWSKMLQMLRDGDVDLIAGVSKTPEREAEFSFSKKPMCKAPTVLTVKAGDTRYYREDFTNWDGIRVGMLKNSVQSEKFSFFAQNEGFSFQSVFYDTITELMAALQDGAHIDAAVTSGLRVIGSNEWIRAQFSPDYMYLIVRKSDTKLLDELNNAMEQHELLFPNFQERLYRKFYTYASSAKVSFSRAEQAFIQEIKESGRTLNFAINPDRKPFSWINENGDVCGIFIDYANEISRRTGLTLKAVPFKTRREYYEKRMSPGVDLVFDAFHDLRAAEKAHIKLSQPYFSPSVSILRDKSAGNTIKTVSVITNSDLNEKTRVLLNSTVHIRFCETVADLLKDIKSSASDAAYLYTRSAEYAVYEDNKNELVATHVSTFLNKFAIGVRESENPALLSVLNKAILSLDEVFADKVSAAYTPKIKKVFSLSMFFYKHPVIAIAPPFLILLAVCAFLSYSIRVRNRSRDEARKHEDFLRLTLQSIGDGVMTTDESGRIQMLNPSGERLIGMSIMQAKGRKHEDVFRIVSALDGTTVESPLRKALSTGKIIELRNHTDLLSFDGKRYHIADCAGPIRTHGGDIIGAVLVFRDVTTEYARKEELQASIALWNAVSDVAKLAPFRMHIPTRRVCNDAERLNMYWPVIDGKAAPPENVVCKEDLARTKAVYEQFTTGKINNFLVTYKAIHNGQIRHYRRYAIHDANNPEIMIGIIQDITLDKEVEQERDSAQALWTQVLKAIPILIYIKSADDDFRYIQCNDPFCSFVGRKRDDIIGHTDADLIDNEHTRNSFSKWDRKIMSEGENIDFYEEVQGVDKSYHLQTVKMPFRDGKGHNLLIGLSVDITKQVALQTKQARQLAEQTAINECISAFINYGYTEPLFDQILEIIRKHLGATYCYVVEIDTKDKISTCLAKAPLQNNKDIVTDMLSVRFDKQAEYFEVGKDSVLGWNDISTHDVPECAREQWLRIISDRKLHSMWSAAVDLNKEGVNGTLEIIYDESSKQKFDQNNEAFIHSAAKMVSMILLRVHSQDDLKNALQQAQSAEKAKSYFLASMSHEIRTPLNAVIGFTEMMLETETINDTQREYIENISIAGNALLQLINDILDLSKLESGQMPILLECVNFPKFCKDVCRTFQYIADQKNLNLIVDTPNIMPPLMIDQMRMRQIFFNLVGNSIKFTPPGGTVHVIAKFTQLTSNTGSLMLQFSDTGIGMAEADQKKIFEPFVQLSKMRGTNSSNNGTGLGLPIVKRLVDRMGGTLTVDSHEGKGTSFLLLFSNINIGETEIAPETIAPAAPIKHPSGEEGGRSDSIFTASHSGQLRVLVVDDVPLNIKIFSALLKRFDVRFDLVTSGQAAIDIMNEKTYDWVLTDLHMPGINGHDLARRIRDNPEYENVRIALVTAELDALEYDKTLFDATLTKPIDKQKLRKCLFGEA